MFLTWRLVRSKQGTGECFKLPIETTAPAQLAGSAFPQEISHTGYKQIIRRFRRNQAAPDPSAHQRGALAPGLTTQVRD